MMSALNRNTLPDGAQDGSALYCEQAEERLKGFVDNNKNMEQISSPVTDHGDQTVEFCTESCSQENDGVQLTTSKFTTKRESYNILQEHGQVNWVIPMSHLITSSRFHSNPYEEGNTDKDHNSLQFGREPTNIYLSSPQFIMGYRIGAPSFWCVQLDPMYNSAEDTKNYISIYLWHQKFLRLEDNDQTIQAIYEIQILNRSGEVHLSKKSGIREFGWQNRCFGWKRFCSYDDLRNVEYPLFLQLKLRLFRKTKEAEKLTEATSDNDIVVATVTSNCTDECSSSSDFITPEINMVATCIKDWIARDLWEDKWGWDVYVCVKNKTYFRVHETILRARSVMLEAHFDSPLCELHEGKKILHISDLDTKYVEAVLKFCYTGKPELLGDYNTICKVLEAAHHMGVNLLKCQCMIQIVTNYLDIENFSKIALLEFRHGYLKFNCAQVMLREFLIMNMKELKEFKDGMILKMYRKNARILAWHLFGR